MKYTPASIESTGHVVLTGPITGTVELSDGTVVDVTQPVIEVHPDNADEVAHLIGRRYADEGHPQVDGDFDYNTDYQPKNEAGVPSTEPVAVAKFQKELRSLTAAEEKHGEAVDWSALSRLNLNKKG